jgi:lysyl-tRNA synthetase, class I
MLVQQASLFPEDSGRINKVFERLLKYGMAKQRTPDLIKRIELASKWFQDLLLLDEESVKIELKENHKKAMAEFIQTLRSLIGAEKDPDTSRNIQSRLYDISRRNKIEPKEFFNLLYRMLINSDRGPRIGNYAVDLGIERTCEILQRYITN